MLLQAVLVKWVSGEHRLADHSATLNGLTSQFESAVAVGDLSESKRLINLIRVATYRMEQQAIAAETRCQLLADDTSAGGVLDLSIPPTLRD